ncbi:hypothetical protein ACLMAJ_23505 [Nocardia sp. KC 131]|uniref:hypothetical protein n=1 Tax=Nocardia arseniciresistens TaxID=3392119 RepID=UPI00398EFBBE
MNETMNYNANDVAVSAPVMSASRGILALQGIGLSSVGVFEERAQFAHMHSPICTPTQDKPSAGWHPVAAKAATGADAFEDGYAPSGLQAARLRNAHPATVNRNRQRCRPR